MAKLSGNKRLVYEQLRRQPGRVSLGTLACLCGCNRRTVQRIVQELSAQGLIFYRPENRRAHYYEVL
jgi:DNA-binding IclR family transcriptional regulator